ncbi:hypothetical protein OHC33_003544 [Knufia fluminis]|uniref:Uncharacterized protein n=2 Tax=Knufia TaxID=430999 RepID=A0AAN8FAY3_9EURO|nr:hypothetical protein OHC33_003544 [Knufia fluminis]
MAAIDDPASVGIAYYYSRGFTEDCLDLTRGPCSGKPVDDLNSTLFTGHIKDLLVDSPFSDTRINRSANGTRFLAPQLPNQADLEFGASAAYQTFTASSFGASALCNTNLSVCTFSPESDSTDSWQFLCPGGMTGNLTSEDWISIGSWWQPESSVNAFDITWTHYENDSTWDEIVEVGLVAFLKDVVEENPTNLTSMYTDYDLEERAQLTNASLIASQCNLTLRGMSYSWTNTTLYPAVQDAGAEHSNLATQLVRATILAGYFSSEAFDPDQKKAIEERLGTSENMTAAEMVSQVQDSISLIGLSLLGGTFKSTPASALALANSAIVTQVGKAPLFTLVILNIWYAGFAVTLSCLAFYLLWDETTRQDILKVQKLLTVDGLAASVVKRHGDKLSSEAPDVRVGVQKVNGTWQLRVFEGPAGTDEDKALLAAEEVEEGLG